MSITDLIEYHNLQPGDVVELVNPTSKFPKHYAVYAGIDGGKPAFVANILDGIQIIKNEQLRDFVNKYKIINIERFNGSSSERMRVIKKAKSRLGEKTYNLIFHNCEHFKNWVIYDKPESEQVRTIGLLAILGGSSMYWMGNVLESKWVKRTGMVITLSSIAILALAMYSFSKKLGENRIV